MAGRYLSDGGQQMCEICGDEPGETLTSDSHPIGVNLHVCETCDAMEQMSRTGETSFDTKRTLNEEDTIGVVQTELGDEYTSALFDLEYLKQLIEEAEAEIQREKVFVHLADDKPLLVSAFGNPKIGVGLSPLVTATKARQMRGDAGD